MFVSFFFNLGEILSTLNQDSNDNVDDSLHVDETGKNNVEENVDVSMVEGIQSGQQGTDEMWRNH